MGITRSMKLLSDIKGVMQGPTLECNTDAGARAVNRRSEEHRIIHWSHIDNEELQ
jgi:hypothetical protein